MNIFFIALAVFSITATNNVVDGHGHHHVRGRQMAEDTTTYANDVPLLDQSDFGLERSISASTGSNLARCGTAAMTTEGQQASQFALDLYNFRRARQQDALQNLGGDGNGGPQADFTPSPKTIPVCFHVVGKKISRQELNKDLEALNKAFSSASCCDSSQSWCSAGTCSPNANIRFAMARTFFGHLMKGTTSKPSKLLACVKRRRSTVDMDNDDKALEVKNAMHVGDLRVLNIYFSQLSKSLGYAYFPSDISPENNLKLDGVVISRGTRVGGELVGFNEGDTLAHEVGYV